MRNHAMKHSRHAGRSSKIRANTVFVLTAISLVLGGSAFSGCSSSQKAQASSQASASTVDERIVRVGTYDSRALAIAYTFSDEFGDHMKKVREALDASIEQGDAQRVKQLDELGKSQAMRRTIQGLSTAPVDDILYTVRNQLPELAQRMNVSIITRDADYHDASLEVIDITDELVKLFDPDAKTLARIDDLCKQPTVPIEVIALIPQGSAKP